jgi:hypothetical protein
MNKIDKRHARHKAYYVKHKSRIVAYWRKKLTGWDEIEYQRARERQGGKCAICDAHESILPRALCADHCSVTGQKRSLLCSRCNRGIGTFKHDAKLLAAALAYVEAYQCVPT